MGRNEVLTLKTDPAERIPCLQRTIFLEFSMPTRLNQMQANHATRLNIPTLRIILIYMPQSCRYLKYINILYIFMKASLCEQILYNKNTYFFHYRDY